MGTAAENGDIVGFRLGLRHGVIAPVTFVISLFSDTNNINEVHKTATGTTSASPSASASSSAAEAQDFAAGG